MRLAHHSPAAFEWVPMILVALCAALPLGSAAAQDAPLVPGVSSIAVTDDAAALLTNPAALGRSVPSGGYFLWDHTDDDSMQVLTGLFGGRGFGIGYQAEQPQKGSRLQRILIGSGGAGRGPVWIGSRNTYEWQRIGIRDSAWRWDMGLLCRPSSFLSVGLLARDLNQGKLFDTVYKRTYQAGIAVRPLPADLRTRLSLYADLSGSEEGQLRENGTIRTGFWATVADGVGLGAAVDGPLDRFSDERRFSLGFRFDFVHASFASTVGFDRNDRVGRQVQALHVTPARQRTLVRERTFTRTVIEGRLADEGAGNLPLPLIGGPTESSARPILRELANARKDPHVRGVLLELRPFGAGALSDEIRDEIGRLRAEGKPVVAFTKEMLGRSQLYVASACDRIVLDPIGDAALLGIRADIPYLGEMLDSLGLRFEKVAHGKYKTAGEQLILDRPSEGETESLNSVLDDINEHQLTLIAEGRKLDRAKLDDLVSGKWWTAEQALAAGLVDSLGDQRAARRILDRLAGGKGEPETIFGSPVEIPRLRMVGRTEDGRSVARRRDHERQEQPWEPRGEHDGLRDCRRPAPCAGTPARREGGRAQDRLGRRGRPRVR